MILAALLQRFGRDVAAVALIEFSFSLPVLVVLGMGGLELTNLVLAHQKVERLASVTSDVFARNQLPPNERQVNDTFNAIDIMSKPYNMRANARLIVTGIIGAEDSSGTLGNRVAWQRCDGSLSGQSSRFGARTSDADFARGSAVALPNDIKLGVGQMVVTSEVFYRYEPMISGSWLPANATAAPFREISINRTRGTAFTSITPVSGVAARTC